MARGLRIVAGFERCFGTESKALAWRENAHGPRGPVRPKLDINPAIRITTGLGRYLCDVGARWNDRTGQKPCRLVMLPATNGPLLCEALLT